MVALAFACFPKFIEPLENWYLLMHAVLQEYVSTDAAGLLKNASKIIHPFNRVLDEDFFKYITDRTYPLEHLSNIKLILSNVTKSD